jgi:hypothetical protein
MDERLLAAVRRLWTDEQVGTAYTAVLTAYASAATKEVTIIGNTFDGQNANAAIILDREGMLTWMDVLEARMREIEAAAADPALTELITGSPITNFSTRYVGT